MTLISQELIIYLRPPRPECGKLHSTDVLHFAAKWVCSLAHWRWIGMHSQTVGCEVSDILCHILILSLSSPCAKSAGPKGLRAESARAVTVQ